MYQIEKDQYLKQVQLKNFGKCSQPISITFSLLEENFPGFGANHSIANVVTTIIIKPWLYFE